MISKSFSIKYSFTTEFREYNKNQQQSIDISTDLKVFRKKDILSILQNNKSKIDDIEDIKYWHPVKQSFVFLEEELEVLDVKELILWIKYKKSSEKFIGQDEMTIPKALLDKLINSSLNLEDGKEESGELSEIDVAFLFSHPMCNENCGSIEAVSYEQEIQNLINIFGIKKKSLSISIEPLNIKFLKDVLYRKPKILHISCHGIYDPKGDFYLQIEDEIGKLSQLNEESINNSLNFEEEPYLNVQCAVIAACHSEAISEVLMKYLKIGVMICINRHTKIENSAVNVFTENFYSYLMEGNNYENSFLYAKEKVKNYEEIEKIANNSEMENKCLYHLHENHCRYNDKNLVEKEVKNLNLCTCESLIPNEHNKYCNVTKQIMKFLNVTECKNHTVNTCCGCYFPNCKHLEHEKLTFKINPIFKYTYLIKPFSKRQEGEIYLVNDNCFYKFKRNIELNSHFVGRINDLLEVKNILSNKGTVILNIYGDQGVGKTWFLNLIYRYWYERKIYKNGIIYLDENILNSESKVLIEIYTHLNISFEDRKKLRIDNCLPLLNDKNILFLFNLKNNNHNEMVLSLILKMKTCKSIHYIITSNSELTSNYCHILHYSLKKLNNEQSKKLILKILEKEIKSYKIMNQKFEEIQNNREIIEKFLVDVDNKPTQIRRLVSLIDKNDDLNKAIQRFYSYGSSQLNILENPNLMSVVFIIYLHRNGILKSQLETITINNMDSILDYLIEMGIIVTSTFSNSQNLKEYYIYYEWREKLEKNVARILKFNEVGNILKNLIIKYSEFMGNKIYFKYMNSKDLNYYNPEEFSSLQLYGFWTSFKGDPRIENLKYFKDTEKLRFLEEDFLFIFEHLDEEFLRNNLDDELKDSLESLSIMVPSLVKSIYHNHDKACLIANKFIKFLRIEDSFQLAIKRIELFLEVDKIVEENNFPFNLQLTKNNFSTINFSDNSFDSNYLLLAKNFSQDLNLNVVDTINNLDIFKEFFKKVDCPIGEAECYLIELYFYRGVLKIRKDNNPKIFTLSSVVKTNIKNIFLDCLNLLKKYSQLNFKITLIRLLYSYSKLQLDFGFNDDSTIINLKEAYNLTSIKFGANCLVSMNVLKIKIIYEILRYNYTCKELPLKEFELFISEREKFLRNFNFKLYNLTALKGTFKEMFTELEEKYSKSHYCIFLVSKYFYREKKHYDLLKISNGEYLNHVYHKSKFKKNLEKMLADKNLELKYKFSPLTEQNLRYYFESKTKVLCIFSQEYLEDYIVCQKEYGKSHLLNIKEYEKIVSEKSIENDLIILGFPQSRKFAKILKEKCQNTVISFEFDETILNEFKIRPYLSLQSKIEKFVMNFMTSLKDYDEEKAFYISKSKFIESLMISCKKHNLFKFVQSENVKLYHKNCDYVDIHLYDSRFLNIFKDNSNLEKIKKPVNSIKENWKNKIIMRKEYHTVIKHLFDERLKIDVINIHGEETHGKTFMINEILNYLDHNEMIEKKKSLIYDMRPVYDERSLEKFFKDKQILENLNNLSKSNNTFRNNQKKKFLIIFDNIFYHHKNEFLSHIFDYRSNILSKILDISSLSDNCLKFILVSKYKLDNRKHDLLTVELKEFEDESVAVQYFLSLLERRLEINELIIPNSNIDYKNFYNSLKYFDKLEKCKNNPKKIKILAQLANYKKLYQIRDIDLEFYIEEKKNNQEIDRITNSAPITQHSNNIDYLKLHKRNSLD